MLTDTTKLLGEAIKNMIETDDSSKPKRGILDTAERNITAHLRNHVEKIILDSKPKYQVDHEYNRMGKGNDSRAKQCPNVETGKTKRIIPDIAVHLRGVEFKNNPLANFLVIEVKKIPRFDGFPEHIKNKQTKRWLEYDIKKLKCLRDHKGKFNYQNTVCVVFSKSNEEKIWISIDGNNFEQLVPPVAGYGGKTQKGTGQKRKKKLYS